jgi:hypothetical protein
LARGKRVLHDLRDEVHTLVGDGHKEWRWPWRRARVPDEGPMNAERWSAQEYRGVARMQFWYLFQLEVGRKGIVDVERPRASPVAGAARDHLDSDRGEEQARLGWVKGQAGVGSKLWGAGIEKG